MPRPNPAGSRLPARGPSPFFRKPQATRLYLLTVLAATYALAIALYPAFAEGHEAAPYLRATYLGCVGASAVLSLIGLFSRDPGFGAGLVLLRCYLIIVLGYGLGGWLSAKLVLCAGLAAEIAILCALPLSLVLSPLAIGAISLVQAFPVLFGASALVDRPVRPRADELLILTSAMAASSLVSFLVDRLAAARDEFQAALRIQEGSVDTLAELNSQLQAYARTIDEEAAERERNRISREIHDISGYIFTNVIAIMDAAGSMPREDHAARTELLVTARRQAQEGLQETRAALRRLRNERPRLMDSGHSLHKIVSIFRQVAGVEVDLNLGNLPRLLPGNLNLALYRTVQEALTNAVRHGKATRVSISFWVEEGVIHLSIRDNGAGAFEVVKGIGLSGMEERVGALGGNVGTGRTPEGGFELVVRVPLPPAPEAPHDAARDSATDHERKA